MTTQFDDLKSLATGSPLHGPEPQIVLSLPENVAAEWKSDEIAVALWQYFKEDAERHAVQLSISGQRVGYLNRESFFDATEQTRLGEAQVSYLPGLAKFSFIKLKCPVAGCPAPTVLKAFFDHRNPPVCSIHADATLEVV